MRALASRFRRPLLLLASGFASAALLAAAGSGTFSVFTASVGGSGTSSRYGTLVMEVESESRYGTLVMEVESEWGRCLSTDSGPGNAATCDEAREFGGRDDVLPGQTIVSKVVVTNRGTLDATSLTLVATRCEVTTSPSHPTDRDRVADLCRRTRLVIEGERGVVFEGVPAELRGRALDLPAPGAGGATTVVFSTTTPRDLADRYQGTAFAVPLTWTFLSSEAA